MPLIAGWNRDEGRTKDDLQTTATKEFPSRTDEFLKVYHVSEQEDEARVGNDFAGDKFLVYSTWAWLEAQVKTGGSPFIVIDSTNPSPGDPFHPVSAGAFHSDEIEYVFGNLDLRKGATFRPRTTRFPS